MKYYISDWLVRTTLGLEWLRGKIFDLVERLVGEEHSQDVIWKYYQ